MAPFSWARRAREGAIQWVVGGMNGGDESKLAGAFFLGSPLPLHGKLSRHWDDADLGVVALFPWVNEARELVAGQDAMNLERLIIGAIWRKVSEIEDRSTFGFERVIGFVFKWEHTKRWLSYDAVAAKERFQQLMTEVIGDQQLFA